MMTERIPCKTPGCARTILPATAERTEGYCMPCVQTVETRKWNEYIKQNRRDLNPFDGITDPVEVLKIVHGSHKHDPLVNRLPHPTPTDQLYIGLDDDQQLRLAEHAASLVGGERNEEAESIILCLAAFTNSPLDSCLRALATSGVFWLGLPFQKASSELRDQLVARVEWDAENRDHILTALAWIGDPVIVDLFARWRNSPPVWRESLHIAPDDYSRSAGWELTDTGQRRNLYFSICFGLIAEPSASPDHFQAITESPESCPWCGKQLINFFDFMPAAFGMDDPSSRKKIQVTTCEVCTMYGTIFGESDDEGNGMWSRMNSRPAYLPDDSNTWDLLPRNPLNAGNARPAFFAADQFLPTTFSQIGGHPTWIQDAAYPCCPVCSATMMFVAQMDNNDIEENAEGLHYAFFCSRCKTTATSYQQT